MKLNIILVSTLCFALFSKKLDETTAELKKTSADLAKEKKKTDQLLYQMFPEKVANELKEGRSVEAGRC